jgi:hypothetical protein
VTGFRSSVTSNQTYGHGVTTGSTQNAGDTDVHALIEEGLAATGVLPTYERLVELDQQLRTAIEGRLPAAQAEANALDHGTREWYTRQSAIDHARRALTSGLGIGLRSAAVQVAELARCCHALHGGR